MAEAALKFFLQRVNSLLLPESENFFRVPKDQITLLHSKLNEIQILLQDGETEYEKKAFRSWLLQLVSAVHDAEDLIDKFVVETNGRDGFDRSLEEINARLTEIINGKGQLSIAPTTKEEGESSSMVDGGQESSPSFTLPYYLRSLLRYCCIFPDKYGIPKGRLVRLLVAEGLVEEREGEIVEDIANDYIEKLISVGILQIVEEYSNWGTRFTVTDQYRKLCLPMMEEENFVTVCKSPDTRVPASTRRVSVHGDGKNIPPDLNDFPIRSLFLFDIKHLSGTSSDCLKRVFYGTKLLRVLDLEGINIKRLPEEVGDLINLRYLGLKKSNLEEIPESVSNLRNLQTFDIRWCGMLSEGALPSGILNLLQLRHLKMFKDMFVCGMRVPTGIGGFKNLQTLTGLYAGEGIAEELGSLTQLRRLRVIDVSEDHASELYSSIMKMKNLLSLKLEGVGGFNAKKLPILDEFSPPPLLSKLCLEGCLDKMPNWFGLMENLTKVRLGFSHLAENPSSILQFLPNLKDLCLWQAYDAKQIGREFCSADGFPKLENLTICSHVLEEWTEIEEGAFPSLKYLRIHNCLKLMKLPEGLQNIGTLQQLYLMPLLDDHEKRLTPDGGEENYKIKHIPLITFITTSMLERLRAPEETPSLAPEPQSL